jgi:hypothetical protein
MEVHDFHVPTTVIYKNWSIGTRSIAAKGAEEKIMSAPNTDCAGNNDTNTIKLSYNNKNQSAQGDSIC